MLRFDDETTALLDRAYRGRDFVHRRRMNLDALDPAPGARVLDIGCGSGPMLAEAARAVGPSGQVTGIDPSPDMLAAAARSCNALDNVEIVEGFAAPLPFEDAAFDGIVSVQVFEYLPDMEAAVAEAARVLRPGGRLVIGDIHWDTLAWHSDRPERMARILHAFDGHFAERRVATLLPPLLARHGLRMQRALPLTFLDAMKRADGISSMMIAFIQAYLRQSSYDDPEELAAWAEEQEALAREGRFYFLLTHVITVAERLPD